MKENHFAPILIIFLKIKNFIDLRFPSKIDCPKLRVLNYISFKLVREHEVMKVMLKKGLIKRWCESIVIKANKALSKILSFVRTTKQNLYKLYKVNIII